MERSKEKKLEVDNGEKGWENWSKKLGRQSRVRRYSEKLEGKVGRVEWEGGLKE